MRTKRKIISMLLCGAMLVSHCTPPAFVEAQTITTADGMCEHHTEHTEDCGYTAGTPETPCAHEHTEDCYTEVTKCVHEHTPECYTEKTEESTSGDDAVTADTEEREPENCTHLCSEESGCITKEWNCPHEEGQHDESCGYVPAEEGTPCGYVCHICPVQDMIDALPGGEEVTGENAGEIKERLEAIDKAKEQLTDEETKQLDVSRYQDAAAALSALDGQTGSDVPIPADIGDTFVVGTLSYKVISTDPAEVELTSGASFTGETLNIPSTVENNGATYTVTSIGDNAFENNNKIKTVTFPDTLTKIGDSAFSKCYSLEGELRLPEGLQEIGSYAFFSDSKIKTVIFPDTLIRIGNQAFINCYGLEGMLTLPEGLKEIGSSAFAGQAEYAGYNNNKMMNITAVNLPNSLEKLGYNDFHACKITSVTVPEQITVLERGVFSCCFELTSVTLPEGLKTIGSLEQYSSGPFQHCTSLKTIELPDGVEVLGRTAFGQSGLTEITLPKNLKTIGGGAFCACADLKKINWNDNLETVNSNAFEECIGLTEVEIPAGIANFDPAAFRDCPNTCTIKVSELPLYAALINFKENGPNQHNTDYEVVYTGSMQNAQFEDDTFTYIVIDADNNYVQILGIKEGVTLNADLTLPEKVSYMDNEYTVTEIGGGVFNEHSELTNITLPDTLKKIGNGAFANCTGLMDLTLPAAVEIIGNSAFYKCTNLQNVVFPNNLTEIGSTAFFSCAIKNIDLSVTRLNKIDERAFYSCKDLESVKLPDCLTTLNGNAFLECAKLESINLPKDLTTMGKDVFNNCTSLAKVDCPPDMVLTELPDYTFAGCINLSEITLPVSIKKIGWSAFNNCGKLQNFTLPAELEELASYAFYFCSGLCGGTLDLPSTVTKIDSSTFDKCDIERLNIDKNNSLQTLGNGAFNGVALVVCFDRSTYEKVHRVAVAPTEVRMMYDIADVLLEPASIGDQIYTGEEIKPEVKLYVEENGEEHFFELDRDYTVAYENNINITADVENGRAKIILTPTKDGSLHGGPREVYFTILAPQKYPVVMQNSDGGTSSASPEEAEEGTKVELTATPDEGYHFVEWQVLSGDVLIENNSFIMPAAEVRIQAVFEADTYTVTLNANGGTINSGDVTSYTYGVGAVLPTADNMAYTRYTFNGWYEDSSFSGSPVTAISATDTGNKTFYAKWVPVEAQSYTVLVSASPEAGGTVSGGGTYTENTSVTITATPNEGYHFVEWQVLSGGVSIENNSFIMPAAEVCIQAVFEADTYTVTLNANGGTINSGDVTSYTYGVGAVLPTADNMSYTGHTFNGWYEDSSFSGSPVTAISATDTGDKTFYAKWVPVKPGAQSYTVLVSANPEAGGTVSGGGTYTENTYVTVTAAAKEGYRFVKWTEDGSAVSDSADYAFTVTADRTLTAVFEKETSDERHEGLWVSGMQDTVPYTGAPVRQENINVYHNSTLLQEKTEYTISYKNNKNAGTAQLIVTGKGNYKGKVTQNFIIEAIDLSRESQNSISATVATAVATGKKLKPAITVTWNQKKLKEKKDYTLTYDTNITEASDDGYDITISGTGNYTGTITRKFRVVPKGTKLLNSAKVTGLAKSYPYQDAAENAIPHGLETDLANLTVKVGKTTLTQGTDYTVRMENAGAVGTASLIIEPAQASSYAGEKRVPVLITGTNLKTCSVTGLEKSYPYTGAPITPDITVFTGKNGTGTKISEGDYIVRYTNNTKPGKATLTVTGIAEKGYSGTLKATYTISRTDLAEGENAGKITVQLPDTASYAKGGAKPQPVIRHTEGSTVHILRENIDYKLIYKNNTAVSAGNTNLSTNRQPAVTITGIGNYRGTITKTFTIVRQDISLLTIAASDKPYSAKKKGRAYYSAPKVYDLDGKQLRQNTDYTVRYTDDATGSEIGKTDIVQNGTKIRVTITAAETSKSGYSGTLSTTYFVRGAADVKDIAKAKTDKIKPQHYTGSPICPKVGLYTTKGKTKTYLTEGEDYEIVGCYNNIRKGTATILIKGKGSFSGIRTVTFKIISADNPLIWSGVF